MESMIRQSIKDAKKASLFLQTLQPERIGIILKKVADRIVAEMDCILAANRLDLAKMSVGNPDYDRLKLTEERIRGIAGDMASIADLPSPYGHLISKTVRPNGMVIRKVSVPFGVIGIIYEARPNVTADVFGLCFKSGSACVLKCGNDAVNSSRAIVDIIHRVLREENLPEPLCTLLPSDRESTAIMIDATGEIDVIIPRGGRGLIDFVRNNSKVPVIETGAGVCHTYIDSSADISKSADVVCNAKTRRVSVCNALDCLIIHKDRIAYLADICNPLAKKGVMIYADAEAYQALKGRYPDSLLFKGDTRSFGIEFRDYKMAVKTVESLEEAIRHIGMYGSHHSECIMSESPDSINTFLSCVDAACVYANVSTAFTDGGQFGFGAEIGISTQKLHARGPMALPELTTYKYLITGDGQTRTP